MSEAWRSIGRRASLAAVAGMCLFGLAALAGSAQAAPRPNFVVLLTDDQRWDAMGVVQRELGAAGRLPWLADATPNMDRLATEGVRFRNAFVVSSLCSPSRAAFLTGKYNHLNGVANNHTPFPTTNTTFASLLRAAGYRTGYFGKWHMGSQRDRPGFAEHASYVGQGRYTDASFLVNGVMTRTVGWVDDVSTDYAIDFINRRAETPFALVLGFKSPHIPLTPPPRLATLFQDAALNVPGNATSFAPYDPPPTPSATSPADVQNYSRTIARVDENVGRVLATLEAKELARDTVVVFASDNGFFLDEHGIGLPAGTSGNKRAAYQESIRIPLLIRYPVLGLHGIVLDPIALNIDLAPTILELAGIPRPTTMQGKSLVGMIAGRSGAVRHRFLYEFFFEVGYEVPTLVAVQRAATS